jgi:cobalamin biosynthesis Mg chelatase CobN
MRYIHRRSLRRLAFAALATAALGLPAGASAARDTVATGRSAPPPTFTTPASARVHGSAPTTAPATAAPNIAAGSAGAAGSATPTTPAAPAAIAPATATPGSPAGVPASTVPVLPAGSAATLPRGARRTTATATKLSTAAIVAAALAALLIVVCLAWGIARWFAYEPRWSVSLRHSFAEAGWRLSASWDEFSDWARLGR